MPAGASAQAYQCRVPDRLSVPEIAPSGESRSMAVTGYTLALSWSPDYCRGRESRRSDAAQCSGRNGRFGMIVHGLWPNGRSGWPQWCPNTRDLTGREAAKNLCMTPSARLQARQWEKHGSCMVRRPATYFKVTRILWNSLRMPDFDKLSRDDDLTAGDIRRAFTRANPDWQPEHVGVQLDWRGWLEELRLCYAKTFMPAPCSRTRLGARDKQRAKIWRGL